MRLTHVQATRLIALILCVAGTVIYGYFYGFQTQKTSAVNWESRIREVGTKNAYGEFAASESSLPSKERLSETRSFGEALYRVSGIAELAVCNSRMSEGCRHQFFTMALAIKEHGKDVIPDLRKSCMSELRDTETPNSCIHAIGSAALFSAGYSQDGLRWALSSCRMAPNIAADHATNECYRGALMEFNLHLMLTGESIRELRSVDLNYPCDQLDGDQQNVCYYTQSQWWRYWLAKNEDAEQNTFKTIGGRCAVLASRDARDACFSGIGTTIAWDLKAPLMMKSALCEVVSASSDDQLLCKLNLAFWGAMINSSQPPEKRERRQDACLNLQGNSYARCLKWADEISDSKYGKSFD